MLNTIIPNFNSEVSSLRFMGKSGFILAFNMTFRGPEYLHSEYPAEWQQIYEDRNYFFVDPVLIWSVTKTGNKRWSEIKLPDIRGVMSEARKCDLNYGAAFSRKSMNKRSFLTISRPDREFTDEELAHLGDKFDHLVTYVVGQCGLTEKELDALRGLRDGLSYKQIAVELDISVPTVKSRAERAKGKLGAKTTTQAVAMASTRNFI
jgi:LuxR family transcriptional regulator